MIKIRIILVYNVTIIWTNNVNKMNAQTIYNMTVTINKIRLIVIKTKVIVKVKVKPNDSKEIQVWKATHWTVVFPIKISIL